MRLMRNRRRALLHDFERRLESGIARVPQLVDAALPHGRTAAGRVAVTASWVSAGIGVIALGIFAGREIRLRYRFKRLTPYDFYSHSGDRFQDADFSVGI